jgi:hypothetical protein
MNIEDYVEWALIEGNQQMYVNGQLRFLAGSVGDDALKRIANLSRRGALVLFPLTEFQEGLHRLGSDFPRDFRYTKSTSRNKSSKDQAVSPELRRLIGVYVTEDLKLLELAKKTRLVSQAMKNTPATDYFWLIRRKMALVASRALRRAATKIESTWS